MSLVSTVLLTISFAFATISLILNVSVKPEPFVNDNFPFTPFNLQYENTTISKAPLKSLTDCAAYVEANVPIVPIFNSTINITNVELTNNYTGAIFVVNRGSVLVNNVTSLNYTKQVISLANSSFVYIQIGDTRLHTIQANGTNSFSLDLWNPPIYPNGTYGGIDGIYDLKRLKIQSAPGTTIKLDTQMFENGTSVLFFELAGNLTMGDVIGITRAVQF